MVTGATAPPTIVQPAPVVAPTPTVAPVAPVEVTPVAAVDTPAPVTAETAAPTTDAATTDAKAGVDPAATGSAEVAKGEVGGGGAPASTDAKTTDAGGMSKTGQALIAALKGGLGLTSQIHGGEKKNEIADGEGETVKSKLSASAEVQAAKQEQDAVDGLQAQGEWSAARVRSHTRAIVLDDTRGAYGYGSPAITA